MNEAVLALKVVIHREDLCNPCHIATLVHVHFSKFTCVKMRVKTSFSINIVLKASALS